MGLSVGVGASTIPDTRPLATLSAMVLLRTESIGYNIGDGALTCACKRGYNIWPRCRCEIVMLGLLMFLDTILCVSFPYPSSADWFRDPAICGHRRGGSACAVSFPYPSSAVWFRDPVISPRPDYEVH